MSQRLVHVHSYSSEGSASLLLLSSCVTVCQGTSNQMTQLGTRENHYNNIVKMYANCTMVLENLEITHTREHQDLSFLQVRRSNPKMKMQKFPFLIPTIHLFILSFFFFSPSRKWEATFWLPWTRWRPSHWSTWGWSEDGTSTRVSTLCWWSPTTTTPLSHKATAAAWSSCNSAAWLVRHTHNTLTVGVQI